MMQNDIFRKKSLERLSSPEELNDYLRILSPSLWALLLAVLMLLAGAFIWGVYGRLDSKLSAVAVSKDSELHLYVPETALEEVIGREAVVDGRSYVLSDSLFADEPVPAGNLLSGYALHLAGLSSDAWVYDLKLGRAEKDGVFAAEIVTERVAPLSFIFN